MSAEERRAAIVRAAIRLFGEKGFRGTTTRELAAVIGVTEPVLYQHFATKGELYRAIIESICEDEQGHKDPALTAAQAAGDDYAFFFRLAELLLDWYEQEPPAIRLLLFSALEGHEMADLFYERKVVVYYKTLSAFIEERIRRKGFRPIDPYLAARVFTGMVAHQGMATTVFGLDDLKGSRKQIIETIVSIFLKGIKSPRSRAR